MTKPLDGVLVVSLEQAVAAPVATYRLIDAGARVIKVERPTGDFARGYDNAVKGESAFFTWLNRGKESISLDFSRHDDNALLHNMIRQADVFVQNLGPGAAARAGLDPQTLLAENPRLVVGSISGYGRSGPHAARKAYDLLIQAESGVASVTGTPEAPGRVGVSICDIAAGLSAYSGILEALLARAVTGRGSVVDTSMFAAMAEWMTVPLLHWEHQQTVWPRLGMSHPVIAPYGAYPTTDDRLVMVGIQNDREWRRFAEHVAGDVSLADDERFATNTQRVAHRPALDEIVVGALSGHTASEALELLSAADIPAAQLNSVVELADHPQLRRLAVDTASGPVSIPTPPVEHSAWSRSAGRVPSLDEHGSSLRQEFALSVAATS